ncbi:MAG: hypothetical protein BGO40_07050 [Chryseobacterium sp. 39-10]|nr:MAG: hypothetical protein BGO40_07050 [Chryseobacterium sp. 39-10]
MVILISTVCPLATSFGTGITLTSKGKSLCISSSSSLLQDTSEMEAVRIANSIYIGSNPILNLLNIAIIVFYVLKVKP